MKFKQTFVIFLIGLWIWIVSSTQNPNLVTTHVTINGLKYDAVWDWGKEVTQQIKSISEVKCTPTKIKIRQDKEGKKASGTNDVDLNTIQSLVGKPRDTTFVDPHTHSFKCIDGRYSTSNLYTMGGDAGEFFLGLVVYEELFGSELTATEVKRLLMGYIDQMEHETLYWCTDDQAVDHIEKAIDEYGIDIQNPRNDIQDSIIDIIAEPNNIGDSHFKTLLNHYQKVNVRKGLIEIFIKVYYRMLWDKNTSYSKKLSLEQLVGSHQEAAFLDIRNDKNWNAPILKAKDKDLGVSVYYNHHEASKARRSQVAY